MLYLKCKSKATIFLFIHKKISTQQQVNAGFGFKQYKKLANRFSPVILRPRGMCHVKKNYPGNTL